MVAPPEDNEVSSYLHYLPAIFQQGDGLFLGRFLLAFEQLLSGRGDPSLPGLFEIVEGISGTMGGLERYFSPKANKELEQAPVEFLPWLAQWVALSFREDWTDDERRDLLSQIIPLYRLRGTKEGLSKMLKIYTDRSVEIQDEFDQFPHYFQVRVVLNTADPDELKKKESIARAIIDQEKPAHTYYALQVQTSATMQIGKRSTIGKDTLLGTRE